MSQNEVPAEESLAHWQQIFLRVIHEHHSIRKMKKYTPLQFARLVTSAGDAVLDRIRYHTQSSGFHQPEQLDKNTGAEASATDLTWSYATILKAMWHRNNAASTTLDRFPHLAKDPFYTLVNWTN